VPVSFVLGLVDRGAVDFDPHGMGIAMFIIQMHDAANENSGGDGSDHSRASRHTHSSSPDS
jgi:hypothetical protein